MRRMLNAIAWVAIVGILVTGLLAADRLGQRPREESPYTPDASPASTAVVMPEPSQKNVGLATALVEKRNVRRTIHASCQVQLDSNRATLVKSFVSGMIERRLCEQGDAVKAGQALFVMRSNDLALAKGQLDLAKTVLDRDEVLIKDKIVSQTQYDTDRAAWLTARNAFVNAREQLLIDGLSEPDIEAITYENQSRWVEAVVTSSIDGTVVQLTNAHTRGDLVPAQTDLCQVADLARVWVIGNAYEKDIASLHTGTPARLAFVAYPGQVWQGTVETIADVVNSATRTVDVRVAVANVSPEGTTPARFPLKPGLFGTMEVECEAYPEGWVWIPSSALLPYFYENGEKGVFVKTDADHFVERHVRVASLEGNDAAVTGDLAPGERVVTQGNIFLTRNEER